MREGPTKEQIKIERLEGTLRYILAQARAGHAGALNVIAANAEAALNDAAQAKLSAFAATGK